MRSSDTCFLGLDTSCYTTSIAAVSGGRVVMDERIMLDVAKGARGLRQSEAVFAHVRNLKALFLSLEAEGINIGGVAYSERPRPQSDSYMPVFTVGETMAVGCARALGVPFHALTHQHGHIYAAYLGNEIKDGAWCALHVSGGTLELLRVEIDGEIDDIETIGGTKDITAGQLIDRVGVAAGLPFPAGKHIEAMYRPGGANLPVTVQGLCANLSGAETQAMRMLESGEDKAKMLSGVIDCAAQTLAALVRNAAEAFDRFIFTGGVVCNEVIRNVLAEQCVALGAQAVFAQKSYCGDNACGLALAAEIRELKENSIG